MLLMELLHFLPLKFWFFLIIWWGQNWDKLCEFHLCRMLISGWAWSSWIAVAVQIAWWFAFFLCSILSLLCKIYCLSLLERLSDEANKPCLPGFAIRVVLLPCTVCPQHLLYLVLPSWPFMRSFPYPQHGDMGGSRSAPALPAYQQCLCIQLTSDAEVHA